MRKYTILHTIETWGTGGAETVLLSLVSHLDPMRFRSLALIPRDGWLREKLQEREVPCFLAESKTWYDFRVLSTMARLIRREKVDLIHSHLPDCNFYSCLVGRLTGCKVIATYHGDPSLSYNGGLRSTLKASVKRRFVGRSAVAVTVVSEYLRHLLQDKGIPAQKIVRIYNGIDTDRFKNSGGGRLRKELGCLNRTRLIGAVSNFGKNKGLEFFIQAARKVADAVPEARFVAVGDVDQGDGRHLKQRLVRLVEELSLQGRFFFLGFREDTPEIISDLDVFVLCSTSEGFSLATIEAMAAGKPVVVTRSGGPEEIVEDGSTGLFVPPADPDSLAEKICELLRDPARGAALGQNARATVENKFALTQMVDQYEYLYERCLNSF